MSTSEVAALRVRVRARASFDLPANGGDAGKGDLQREGTR